ncbi:MAG TPA: AbrB/MazE/SpoVT family DNA-binding domain-containing protein [Pantanalinema sp.]
MPKIAKNGNSLTVALPPAELLALGLKQGDEVMIRRRGSVLELVPVEMRPKLRPSLEKALDRTVEKFGPALERLAK